MPRCSPCQANHWTAANENDQYAKLSEKWLELDKFFFEHHELRKYFYDGQRLNAADVSSKECSQAISAAFYAIDFTDYVMNALELAEKNHSSSLSTDQRKGWTTSFRETFFTSPLICTLLQRYRTSYSDSTWQLGRQSCAGFTNVELPECKP